MKKKTLEEKRISNINKQVQEGSKRFMQISKKNKNDEFYTKVEDIKKEVSHYKSHFKGKVVLMNCDDPEWSNFWNFFVDVQQDWGIKKLISTHYRNGEQSYALYREEVWEKGELIGYEKTLPKEKLIEADEEWPAGDFRSKDAIELLEEADIIVTNPPFSLFREFVRLLINKKKKFLIMGNSNAITSTEIWNYYIKNKIRMGIEKPGHSFINPKDKTNWDIKNPDTYEFKKLGMTVWFTNLGKPNLTNNIKLNSQFKGNEKKYHKLDNVDAININKVKQIPHDYDGLMAVPATATFFQNYDKNQFEIIGLLNGSPSANPFGEGKPILNGKAKFARVLIKRR